MKHSRCKLGAYGRLLLYEKSLNHNNATCMGNIRVYPSFTKSLHQLVRSPCILGNQAHSQSTHTLTPLSQHTQNGFLMYQSWDKLKKKKTKLWTTLASHTYPLTKSESTFWQVSLSSSNKTWFLLLTSKSGSFGHKPNKPIPWSQVTEIGINIKKWNQPWHAPAMATAVFLATLTHVFNELLDQRTHLLLNILKWSDSNNYNSGRL